MSQAQMYSVPPPPRDWGGAFARVLCLVFGLLGALPLGAGFWLKSEAALNWASQETSRTVRNLIGIEASYTVALSLLPLEIRLNNVRVEGVDGTPALTAQSVVITPRIFSLIAGRVDIGDIEIESLTGRIVLKHGELQNVKLKVPKSEGAGGLTHAPFSALSVSDAQLDVTIDGVRVNTGTIDADAFVEGGNTFEIALRVGETWVYTDSTVWPTPEFSEGPLKDAQWDGDVLCQLDARVRVEESQVLLRRLSMLGTLDIDPASGTKPTCKLRADDSDPDPGRFALRAHQLRIAAPSGAEHPELEGNVMLRMPVDLANRFAADPNPFKGWVGLSGDIRWLEHTRLPELTGSVRVSELWYGAFRLLEGIEGPLNLEADQITSPELKIGYGGGRVRAYDFLVDPLAEGVPLRTSRVEIQDVPFEHLMRDVNVTPNTIIHFIIDDTVVSGFGGELSPLDLRGDLAANADRFEVYDRSYRDPARQRMIGINQRASIRGRFGVTLDALHFENEIVRFGHSQIKTTVRVGFADWMELSVSDSKIDLADVSPLVNVPMSGVLELSAEMAGPRSDPVLNSKLSVSDLDFGGFPVGHLDVENLKFRPLYLELTDAVVRKGRSAFQLPVARFDFQTDAGLQLDAVVRSKNADVRDFLALWNLDSDPRWEDLKGRMDASAELRYLLGGPRDACNSGRLTVNGRTTAHMLELFGERYDSADAEFDFRWTDMDAGYLGMTLELPGFQMRKGSGSILGTLNLGSDAEIRGNIVATAIPLSHLDGLGELGNLASGTVSAVGNVSGTLDAMQASAQVNVGPLIVGRSRLPGSRLLVNLVPKKELRRVTGEKTACGHDKPTEFDHTEFEADKSSGEYVVRGQLFGGQIKLNDVSLSSQRGKIAKGLVEFENLQLGPLLALVPEVGLARAPPTGELTGAVHLKHLPLDNWHTGAIEAELQDATVEWRGFQLKTRSHPQFKLEGGKLSGERFTLDLTTPAGQTTSFEIAGHIARLGTNPTLDLLLRLKPIELASFTQFFERGDRVKGTLKGEVRLLGTFKDLRQEGGFYLRDGELVLRGNPIRITNANLDIKLEGGQVHVTKGSATTGGGTVTVTGSAPLRGFKLGEFRSKIKVQNASLPLAPDVKIVADADLDATWYPKQEGEERPRLPRIGGQVVLRSFEYSRPVTMNADIAALTGKGRSTKFESYDPSKDIVDLDILITANGPLRLANNLIDANLQIDKPGLQLTGTNQRFGLRGRVRLEQGGRIRMRRSEFEVRSGEVRFDDATQIQPRVDVTAVTEYRRFSSTTSTGSAPVTGGASGASTAGSAAGQWRITLHAYGDAENLKLDLSSQPKLSQDDIFLLLTLGLTRAELDQAQSASLGESVALEALGSLTGADSAVTDAIPVIDEFRFGSAYSARTGRTEPTVTIGKRLTKRIRAYVTSGLSESREVRSNLEWRLNPRMSVEGSYDNINAISSSSFGNIGADIRWRLEFH